MVRLERLKCLAASFLRYLVAGGLGFVVDYSALFLLYRCIGLHYLMSAGVAFVAGLVFVYVSSNMWVFSTRKMQDKQWLEFVVFALIGLVGLALTVSLMWVFVEFCAFNPLVSKLVTTGIVLIWNFSARKLILY